MKCYNKNCAKEIAIRDREISDLKMRLYDLYRPVIDSLNSDYVRSKVQREPEKKNEASFKKRNSNYSFDTDTEIHKLDAEIFMHHVFDKYVE